MHTTVCIVLNFNFPQQFFLNQVPFFSQMWIKIELNQHSSPSAGCKSLLALGKEASSKSST